MVRTGKFAGITVLALGVLIVGAVVVAHTAESTCEPPALLQQTSAQMGYNSLDLEDHSGYSSEYIFGLSKGVVRSTLTPALKPMLLLVTVPVDLVMLPFAAVGGFFH